MFSQKEFIEASRKFVCIRIESYESKETQDMVRSYLDGRFENTAFCILSPDGKKRLSRSGRGPSAMIGRRGGEGEENADAVIEALEGYAKSYRPKGSADEALLQDFNAFRQALNISSGDQRLLAYIDVPTNLRGAAQKKLEQVFNDTSIIGRFHTDLSDSSTDADWQKAVSKVSASSAGPAIYIIKPDTFGLKGDLMKKVPMSASVDSIKSDLLAANTSYAESEKRKVYNEHVQEGRREGAFFENGMPYGEDRDGDGVIDQRAGGKGKGKGKGKGNK